MTTDILQSPAANSREFGQSTYARWLGKVTDGICGLAAAGTMLVVLMQVASRLLGTPISWTEELTRACFIWMIFIGSIGGFFWNVIVITPGAASTLTTP